MLSLKRIRHTLSIVDKESMKVQANKSPEPTAVGAVRSAVAVRVAGRRWLSFCR
jgi:hypothetical protein